ncbi:MAG: DNA repair protein RecO [Candidatus Pelagibacter sp.]
MIWDDIGFLLSKNKYSENSLISEFYTKNHGKVTGMIFGGTSRKIKNYLQIGNKIHLNYQSKSENKIGFFKVEIEQALSPLYFDNQQKLSCINSAMNLIKILTADFQKNEKIFKLIEDFYQILKSDYWIKNYVLWELELFKLLGYDLVFENVVEKKIIGDHAQYISKSLTDKKIIPNFLIDQSNEPTDLETLLNGLRIVGDFLDKTILKPNNLTQPFSRLQFINTLK